MSLRYFVEMTFGAQRVSSDARRAWDVELREVALDLLPRSEHLRVFASPETPILVVPERGIVIGHLFAGDGRRVIDGHLLAQRGAGLDLQRLVLEAYWGEYVLVETSGDSPHALRVLRDPSGGIPCFYTFKGNSGFVTSSISVAEHFDLYDRQVDWDTIAHKLTYPYLRTRRTALRDIEELLPGCSLSLRSGGADTRLAWSPWTSVAADRRYHDPREAAAGVRHAVAACVAAWAETDETVLLELSGGLDSSIVAACLRGVHADVTCCTILAPVPGTDERSYARQMTDYLGVQLQSVSISFDSARFFFAPQPDATSPGMGILHLAVDEAMDIAGEALGTTSFFSGGGGDSVFCYLKGASPAADAFKERGFGAGVAAIRNLSTLHQCTFWKAARLTLRKLRRGPKAPWNADHSFLSAALAAIPMEAHPWFDAPPDTLAGDHEKVCELVGSQSYRDGMARTIRRPMRFPLLSQPVVETCLRVPSWMWIAEGQNRAVARAAFADRLPPDVLGRRSKGTYMNYCGAVYTKNKVGMREFLTTGRLEARGLLDRTALDRFFDAQLAPRDLSFMRIFDLCMVENWLRHQP